MKTIFSIFIFLIVYSTSAQVSFQTGYSEWDSNLKIIDARASADFDTFKTNLSLSFNISERKIDYMAGSLSMSPGEIYLAFDIASLSGNGIDDVITIYQQNRKRGWGYIAQEAGIKPGSQEFHQLKKNADSSAKNGKGGEKSKGKSKRTKIG